MVSHMNLNHARLPISPHPHIKLLFLIIEIALCVWHSAEPNSRFGERHGAKRSISPHPHIKLFLIIEIDLCVRHSAEPNGRFGERHGAKRSISPLGKFVTMSLPIKLHFRRSWQKR